MHRTRLNYSSQSRSFHSPTLVHQDYQVLPKVRSDLSKVFPMQVTQKTLVCCRDQCSLLCPLRFSYLIMLLREFRSLFLHRSLGAQCIVSTDNWKKWGHHVDQGTFGVVCRQDRLQLACHSFIVEVLVLILFFHVILFLSERSIAFWILRKRLDYVKLYVQIRL